MNKLLVVLTVLALLYLHVTPAHARIAQPFCSCGATSAQVRTWNNNALATPKGQARINRGVTAEIEHNPPADAPFIEQAGRIVKKRSRGIAAHSLGWFKAVYKRCPGKFDVPGCHAMRNCLIAGYTVYVADRVSGLSVKRSLRDGTLACLASAFATLAGRAHVVEKGMEVRGATVRCYRRRERTVETLGQLI